MKISEVIRKIEDGENVREVLKQYVPKDLSEKEFLNSLKYVPDYVVLTMIKSFIGLFSPETLAEMAKRKMFGSNFVLESDRTDWTLEGISGDRALCRPINSDQIIPLDLNSEVINVF